MTAVSDPRQPQTLVERYQSMHASLRWMLVAAIGLFVVVVVQSISDTELLTAPTTTQTTLRWSIPLLLAGLGGLFSERASSTSASKG